MSFPVYEKDPQAKLDYAVDWATWLPSTDTIQTSTWIVPVGITKVSDSNSTTKATIWLSGGRPGQRYTVVNQIVTVGGRENQRSIIIAVQET